MTTTTVTTYGPGGYDPDAEDGNVVAVEEVEVEEAPPTPEQQRIADLEDALAVVTAELLGGTA